MNGGGALLRTTATLRHILHRHTITTTTHHVKTPPTSFTRQTNTKAAKSYLRVSHFAGYCSSSSNASATSTTSSGFVGWYLGMVKSKPILTKSLTSALIYTAADVSAQTIIGQPSEGYDFVRTLRMAGYGFIVLGPTLHFWFNFMSRLFPKKDIISTFKKMFMGQAVFGPAMTVLFFSVNAFLQGENTTEIVARLKRDLLPTMFNGVMYWPICDFITFRFTPVHLQPLTSNSFSYLWTIYITYMASREKAVMVAS